jgi:hypothetical protein
MASSASVMWASVIWPGVLDAGAQRDPPDRPTHRLVQQASVVAEGDAFFDQLARSKVDAHRGGRIVGADLLGAEHPGVVEVSRPAVGRRARPAARQTSRRCEATLP